MNTDMSLFKAATDGNEAEVRRLLAEGADPNRVDACYDEEQARSLAEGFGQAPEILEQTGFEFSRTALHHAAVHGHVDVARILLDAGADLEIADIFGQTPLLNAVQRHRQPMCRFLIERGADVDRLNRFGEPVLTMALRLGLLSTATALKEHRASLNPAVEPRFSPLAGLLDAFPPSQEEELPFSPEQGMAWLEELLAAGADAGQVEVLQRAFRTDRVELVERLKEAGADLSTGTGHDSWLGWAVSCDAVNLVEYLIDDGADPNDLNGTVLSLPVAWGDEELTRRLLDAGADPNRPTENGTHILLKAADRADGAGPVHALLQAGADPNPTTPEGWTPLFLADRRDYRDIVEILSRWEASYGESRADTQREARQKRFLETPVAERRGVDSVTDASSLTAMMVASPAEDVISFLRRYSGIQVIQHPPMPKKTKVFKKIQAHVGDVLWLVRLKGHQWTHLIGDRKGSLFEEICHELRIRGCWVSYSDGSHSTSYELREKDQILERFGTDGEGFVYAYEDRNPDDVDTSSLPDTFRFESVFRDRASIDLTSYYDESQFVDDFLCRHDIYLPHTYMDRESVPHAWPEDTFELENVAESWVVLFEPEGLQTQSVKPDEATRQLYSAAYSGDAAGVRRALTAGASPTAILAGHQDTPLARACTHLEAVRVLLEAGADPNNGGRDHPLWHVVRSVSSDHPDPKALETLSLLIQKGADVHGLDPWHGSLLHGAHRVSLVKCLLLAGVDPSVTNSRGLTASEEVATFVSPLLSGSAGTAAIEATVELLRQAEQGSVTIEETWDELIRLERQAAAEKKT